MRGTLSLSIAFGMMLSTPAHAEPLFGIPALLLKSPLIQLRESNALQVMSGASADRFGPRATIEQGQSAAQALLEAGPRFMPVEFQIEAMADHRGFATQSVRQGPTKGMTVALSNDTLGVGTTVSYDMRMGTGWLATPFVSIDYNRVDTTHVINAHSPYAYARNNGDTGITGSAGGTLSHDFEAVQGLSVVGYGALTAASSRATTPEDVTMATRVVQALSVGGAERIGYEVGAGTRLIVSQRLRFDGGFVQSARATAAVIALHGAF